MNETLTPEQIRLFRGANHTDGTRMSMTVGYRSVDELAGVEDAKC